jgi:Protein of unknown function (DUF2752)
VQAEQHLDQYQLASSIERIAAAGMVALSGAASALVGYFDPSTATFFPLCPLYAFTGFACPGCGLTRGFHALFHGRLWQALHFNALIPVWTVIFGYVFISMILLVFRGRGLHMWPATPQFLWLFMVVLIAFGVLRNLPIYPLSLLFP